MKTREIEQNKQAFHNLPIKLKGMTHFGDLSQKNSTGWKSLLRSFQWICSEKSSSPSKIFIQRLSNPKKNLHFARSFQASKELGRKILIYWTLITWRKWTTKKCHGRNLEEKLKERSHSLRRFFFWLNWASRWFHTNIQTIFEDCLIFWADIPWPNWASRKILSSIFQATCEVFSEILIRIVFS